MDEQDDRESPERRYPPLYEEAVPIALGIIVLIMWQRPTPLERCHIKDAGGAAMRHPFFQSETGRRHAADEQRMTPRSDPRVAVCRLLLRAHVSSCPLGSAESIVPLYRWLTCVLTCFLLYFCAGLHNLAVWR